MPRTLAAEFETRRDAEMTVEHLVQEYKLDRGAVTIVSASAHNSAGTKVAGSDTEGGYEKGGTDAEPKLSGKLRVSVECDEALDEKVLGTFVTYHGRQVDG